MSEDTRIGGKATPAPDYSDFERQRLLALHRFGLLDTPSEKIFDGITEAVAAICQTPIALISLIDEKRQWFKSAFGLTIKETSRDIAFCDHAIKEPTELMIVEDAENDDRFRNNPLVLEQPNIRFYAGQPLVSDDGFPLGTLCVIDQVPRVLDERQKSAIVSLAATVTEIFAERTRMEKTVLDRSTMEDAMHGKIDSLLVQLSSARGAIDEILSKINYPCLAIDQINDLIFSNSAWNEMIAKHTEDEYPTAEESNKATKIFDFIASKLAADEGSFLGALSDLTTDEAREPRNFVSAPLKDRGIIEIHREHRNAEFVYVALKD